MVGCLYELNGEIKAYPNMERLLKKFPNAKVIKEVQNINNLDRELLQYKGVQIKEKPVFEGQRPYTHTCRVNVNTVLCAYSQEDLDKLKMSYIK
jgi:hypothetical protein